MNLVEYVLGGEVNEGPDLHGDHMLAAVKFFGSVKE